jgi:hypothetical protein
MAAESGREGGKFSRIATQSHKASEALTPHSRTRIRHEQWVSIPAPDAEAPRAQDDWAEEKPYPDGLGGQVKDLAIEKTAGPNSTPDTSSKASVARTFVNSQCIKEGAPKGKNITAGGFKSDDRKNASFNSEIGSKNDPSRLAELKMQRAKADAAGDAVIPRPKGMTGDNKFDALGGDTSA